MGLPTRAVVRRLALSSSSHHVTIQQRSLATTTTRLSNPLVLRRPFTASANNKTGNQDEQSSSSSKNDTFADTIHRLSGKKDSSSNENGSSSSANPGDNNEMFRKVASVWDGLQKEVQLAWKDLLASGQRKDINKKIVKTHPHNTPGGDAPYTGPVDLVIIDPSENLTAWERMQKRLADTPIIAGMLQRSEQLYESTGAKQVKEKVDHLREDAKEAWETSQNPWVYRLSSVYDTLTAETPESIAVKELRVLDPEFTLEDWRQDVVEHTLPQIMTWFLEGKINQLKPWLGESVFKRIAAEITARQQEGVEIDTHILGIMNSEILAVEVCVLCCLSLRAVHWYETQGRFHPHHSRCGILSTARRSRTRIAHHIAAFHGPANQLHPQKDRWEHRRRQ